VGTRLRPSRVGRSPLPPFRYRNRNRTRFESSVTPLILSWYSEFMNRFSLRSPIDYEDEFDFEFDLGNESDFRDGEAKLRPEAWATHRFTQNTVYTLAPNS
jgi:hypothetical protein